jgi:hypothetical protein
MVTRYADPLGMSRDHGLSYARLAVDDTDLAAFGGS